MKTKFKKEKPFTKAEKVAFAKGVESQRPKWNLKVRHNDKNFDSVDKNYKTKTEALKIVNNENIVGPKSDFKYSIKFIPKK